MRPSDSIEITFDDAPLRALLREFPDIANSEMNRAYKKVGSDFMKKFTKARLRKGIFNPKRKGKFKKTGSVSLPVKALKAGFVGRIHGSKALEGKMMRIHNSSPLIVMRDQPSAEARTIRPRKGKWLYIRGSDRHAFGGGKNGRARRNKWMTSHSKQLAGRWGRYLKPIVARVRKVGPFPELGFRRMWRAYRRTALKTIQNAVPRMVRRAELFVKKKAGKFRRAA